MDNMKIYNQVREVPFEAKKEITAGRLKGFTDIEPMWRIQKLTELYGPCGTGWWAELLKKEIVYDELTKQKAAFVDINLYVVDPETGVVSHPIFGTGGSSFVAQENKGPYLSDECYKMAYTDAISVAAKALGFGANTYWGRGSKYTNKTVEEKQDKPEEKPQKQAPAQKPAKQAEQPQEKPKPKMAAPGTIEYIEQIATKEQISELRKKYGESLERMTQDTAAKAIARIREVNGIE